MGNFEPVQITLTVHQPRGLAAVLTHISQTVLRRHVYTSPDHSIILGCSRCARDAIDHVLAQDSSKDDDIVEKPVRDMARQVRLAWTAAVHDNFVRCGKRLAPEGDSLSPHGLNEDIDVDTATITYHCNILYPLGRLLYDEMRSLQKFTAFEPETVENAATGWHDLVVPERFVVAACIAADRVEKDNGELDGFHAYAKQWGPVFEAVVVELKYLHDFLQPRKQFQLGGNGGEESRCVVCRSATPDTLLLPCKHMCMCTECATSFGDKLHGCPLCRKPVTNMIDGIYCV